MVKETVLKNSVYSSMVRNTLVSETFFSKSPIADKPIKLLDESSLMKMAAFVMSVPLFKPFKIVLSRAGSGFENWSSALA